MPYQPQVMGRRYMIVAGHYLAAEAGLKILEAGGNAIDAGVAAGIALGVLHSDQVQFSGVAPMLIYHKASHQVFAVAGLGAWPRAVEPRRFEQEFGGHIPLGILRTVVPAAPHAWIAVLARFGTLGFGEVAASAIRYAREGFAVHPVMAEFITRYRDNYAKWPANAAIWLKDSQPPKVGDLLVQSDLAAVLQYMADEERAAAGRGREAGLKAACDAFYLGDIAARMLAHQKANGGLLSAEDLAAHTTPIEAPIKRRFRDCEVYSCGPWCQGPVLLQMLALLEGIDLAALGHNSTAYIHTIAEAMKLSFADRERFYGDPRFVDVPLERLLSAAYAAQRRRLIDPARAWPAMPPAGDIAGHGGVSFAAHANERETAVPADTSYCCAIDRHGNVVSITPSDVSFESPAVPGLGFCPSARGAQSFALAGHASSVAPGKRPRLTPNPALVLKPGEFALPFGAPGGDHQPQGMLQVLLNHLVFGMPIQEAIEAPRFSTHSHPNSFEPHDSHPGRLTVEERIPAATMQALAGLGHKVEPLPAISMGVAGVCAISADLASGLLAGGADPRRCGRAMGF
ncbi:MAG: gamma-glutamyltransferase family protein [Alphaproteobacteria bacterium]|nr:gamma-glutamyltransferase family protein [Alphaproteobacteria bacterium]